MIGGGGCVKSQKRCAFFAREKEAKNSTHIQLHFALHTRASCPPCCRPRGTGGPHTHLSRTDLSPTDSPMLRSSAAAWATARRRRVATSLTHLPPHATTRAYASARRTGKPPPSLPPGVARGALDSLTQWALGGGSSAAATGGRPRAVPAWVKSRLNAPEGEGERERERGRHVEARVCGQRASLLTCPALPTLLSPSPRTAWAPRPGARWLPAEWTARPGPRARIAILDALGLTPAGGVVLRALPSLAARAIAADPPPLPAPASPPPATVRSPPPPGPVARAVARVAAVVVVVVAALQVAVRAAWLAAVFAPLALSARRCLSHDAGHPDRSTWIASLRSTLERAGPAFIKYGQWAATRHDLFPRDLCSELERLHAAAPAHPRSVTAAAVASAFDASLDDLFDGFPDKPVASGSIGQVYRARLSDAGARRARLPPGTIVAVKVRHPGVEAAIARDFAIMMAAARAATVVLPSLADARFAETLAQFELPLREQVDFEHEARSLWRFCYNFRERDGVRFPQPVYPLVSPAVLVETFESGGAITEHVSAGPGGRYGTALARLGSDAVLHMLLVDNFVHADLVRRVGGRVGERVGSPSPLRRSPSPPLPPPPSLTAPR